MSLALLVIGIVSHWQHKPMALLSVIGTVRNQRHGYSTGRHIGNLIFIKTLSMTALLVIFVFCEGYCKETFSYVVPIAYIAKTGPTILF